jgi:putative ABC transport system permease protein
VLRGVVHDLRYALRQSRKAPGFALTVLLTLALSVGLATAVFCVLDAVVLRPLPYPQPDRIVEIDSHNSSGGYYQPASWPSYQDERAQTTAFKALAGYFRWREVAAETPDGPAVLQAVRTTDNFFDVFAAPPMLGRTFLPGEQIAGKNDVVVLSYEAWSKHFNSSRDVVGAAVPLDGRAYTIVGVMSPGFRYPFNARDAIYTPVHLDAAAWMQTRGGHWLRMIGRLNEGASAQAAQADLAHVFANLARAYPETDGGRTVQLVPLSQSVDSKSRGPIWVLLGAVLAVLAIGCVNIAGLLLARGVKREREMAMRVAIGAGRRRLLSQVLTESLVLAAGGAAGGMLLAWILLDLLRTFLVKALQRGADIHMNWTVLGAAVAIAVCASVAASLVPALRLSGVDPNRALRSGGSAGADRTQHRLRAGFIITQVALTLVLLVVAGMLIRVVTRYQHEDLGFEPQHILAIDLHIAPGRYEGRDPVSGFFNPLLDRVRHIPGVRAAGLIDMLPVESWGSNSEVHIAGQPPNPKNAEILAESRMVSPGYYDVFGIPLRAGRALSASLDGPSNKAGTVLANQAFVAKFLHGAFPSATPHIDDHEKPEEKTAIVGVTGSVRQDLRQPALAEMDFLIDEIPLKDRATVLSAMVLVVRSAGDPKALIPALTNALHDVDPTVPLADPRTMSDAIADELALERMEGWLFGIFAALALLLALVGLYGLVSHEVELSTHDIGVRMALGASRDRILAMIMRRVTWTVGAGAVAGLILTVFARKTIGMVIYFDTQKEVGGFLLLAFGLLLAGLVAALIPAARAASIDPMRALRTE